MDSILIRKAGLDDLEQLYAFEQGIIQTERPFDPTLKDDPIHYYDLKAMLFASDVELVVADTDGKIIGSGYVRIEKAKDYLEYQQFAYIGFMYVLPAYRGKGINKKILDHLIDWSRKQNLNEVRLEVYNDNVPAISAYEKCGFKKHIIEMRLGLETITNDNS